MAGEVPRTTYTDSTGRAFSIQISPLAQDGALNDTFYKVAKVTPADSDRPNVVVVEASEEFLRYQKRNESNKKRDDEDILTELTQFVVWIEIEKGLRTDRSNRIFRTDNSPETYELTLKQLDYELAWQKIRLVKDPRGKKYLIFKNHKYYIPNSTTRNALGFPQSRFIPLTEAELSQFPSGNNVDDVKHVRLIRNQVDHDPVYALFTTPVLEKRHVPDEKTLEAMGRRQQDVEVLSRVEFSSIVSGGAIQSHELWDTPLPARTRTEANKPTPHFTQIFTGSVEQVNSGNVERPTTGNRTGASKKKDWYQSNVVKVILLLSAVAGIALAVLAFWPRQG